MFTPTRNYAVGAVHGVYLPNRSADMNATERFGAAGLSDADYIAREVDKLAVGECEESFEPSGPRTRQRTTGKKTEVNALHGAGRRRLNEARKKALGEKGKRLLDKKRGRSKPISSGDPNHVIWYSNPMTKMFYELNKRVSFQDLYQQMSSSVLDRMSPTDPEITCKQTQQYARQFYDKMQSIMTEWYKQTLLDRAGREEATTSTNFHVPFSGDEHEDKIALEIGKAIDHGIGIDKIYAKGYEIEALYEDVWYDAEITASHDNGTYDINYANSSGYEKKVASEFIRHRQASITFPNTGSLFTKYGIFYTGLSLGTVNPAYKIGIRPADWKYRPQEILVEINDVRAINRDTMPATRNFNTEDLKKAFKKVIVGKRKRDDPKGNVEWKDRRIYIFMQPAGSQNFPDAILCWGKQVKGSTQTRVNFLYVEAKSSKVFGNLTTNATGLLPNTLYFIGQHILAGTSLTTWKGAGNDLCADVIGQVLNRKMSPFQESSPYNYRKAAAVHRVPDLFRTNDNEARMKHVLPMLRNWLKGFPSDYSLDTSVKKASPVAVQTQLILLGLTDQGSEINNQEQIIVKLKKDEKAAKAACELRRKVTQAWAAIRACDEKVEISGLSAGELLGKLEIEGADIGEFKSKKASEKRAELRRLRVEKANSVEKTWDNKRKSLSGAGTGPGSDVDMTDA